jgi:hypothetical protein
VCTQEGWVLQYSFTAFSAFKITAQQHVLKTKSVFSCRETTEIPADKAEAILTEALSDTAMIAISGEKFGLPGEGYDTFEDYNAMYLQRMSGPQRLPSIVSRRNGIHTYTYPRLDTLELELKSNDVPFDNFAELFAEIGFPFLSQGWGGWNSQRTEITIAPPAFVEHVEIKAGHSLFMVRASDLIDTDLIKVALKLIPVIPSQVQRRAFSGTVNWEVGDGSLLGRFEMAAADIGLVQLYLRYDEEFLGAWWARDIDVSFSQRTALHKVVDSNGLFMQKFFDDRNSFEERITVLLSLLNLDCLFYGKIAELKDAPDILALSAQGHLYVVECSTGDINSRGKLRRLYERTNDIRTRLANSHFRPREILSVVIASVPHRETLHCIEELQNYGIALVAREGIERLLSQIEAPPTAEQLFAVAMASVPVKEIIQPIEE